MREDIKYVLSHQLHELRRSNGEAIVDKRVGNATIRIHAKTFNDDFMPLNPVFSTAC
jgi:hypothetical protein